MSIELYSWPRSSGTRVVWALEELGIPYRYIDLDPKKEENLSPTYLAVNPHGKVPALVDDNVRFFESAAILLHLGERYGVAKKLWPAAGGQPRADALCWTVWAMTELMSYMMQYLYHGLDTPVSYAPESRHDRSAVGQGRLSARYVLARRCGRRKRVGVWHSARARPGKASAHRSLAETLHAATSIQTRSLELHSPMRARQVR
jgi:glutathione S-transferase